MISVSVRIMMLAPIWGIGIIFAVLVGASIGPGMDESLWPVITDQSVSDVTRTTDRACWRWTYTKQRNAYEVHRAFYIERDDGIRFPVAEIRADLEMPSNDSTAAKAGITRTLPECVTIPYVMRGTSRFTVRGTNYYRSWIGWELSQPVVTVNVDFPAP